MNMHANLFTIQFEKTDLCEGEVPGMENSGPGPGMEAYLIK